MFQGASLVRAESELKANLVPFRHRLRQLDQLLSGQNRYQDERLVAAQHQQLHHHSAERSKGKIQRCTTTIVCPPYLKSRHDLATNKGKTKLNRSRPYRVRVQTEIARSAGNARNTRLFA